MVAASPSSPSPSPSRSSASFPLSSPIPKQETRDRSCPGSSLYQQEKEKDLQKKRDGKDKDKSLKKPRKLTSALLEPAIVSSDDDHPGDHSDLDTDTDTENAHELSDEPTSPPPLPIQWVHGGAQYLDLLTVPVTSLNPVYTAFSESENRRLEERWEALSEEEKRRANEVSGIGLEKIKEEQEKEKEKAKSKGTETEDGGKGDGKEHTVESIGASGIEESSVLSFEGNPKCNPLKETAVLITTASDTSNEDLVSEEPEVYPDPVVTPFVSNLTADKYSQFDETGFPFPPPGMGISRNPSPARTQAPEGLTGGRAHIRVPSGRPEGMSRRQSILDTTADDDLDEVKGVAVAQDGLFEVSIDTMSLSPVFWAHNGPRVPVIRATWFINDEQHPCEWELAQALEQGYQEIKPWLTSYPQELQMAIEQGSTAEEKLKVKLDPKFNVGQSVVYQDADCGQLVQTGMGSYLNKLFWSSMRSKAGGTMVYRGFEAAQKASGHASKSGTDTRRDSHHSQRSTGSNHNKNASISKAEKDAKRKSMDGSTLNPASTMMDRQVKSQEGHHQSTSSGSDHSTIPSQKASKKRDIGDLAARKISDVKEKVKDKVKGTAETFGKPDLGDQTHSAKAMEEQQVPVTKEEDEEDKCTDLILVIHGIGQQLAAQYEGFNFVYATNMLRAVMKTQGQNHAIASIVRDRRVQVLPIQWRASLELEHKYDEEDVQHGMNNRFSISDITLTKVPMIRQMANSVLLDIPMFMSHHRQAMLEAVCSQANRTYRMWCARNPGFDGKGRVHIIAHSLGSALAAHILSDQPTQMPPLATLPKSVRSLTKNQFLFNTSNLFLCGSPLGIFLHLDQAQIMPRKGRERTMNSPPEEALERAGRFGCMAIDSLYNVVHLSDPIAYTLNATVDSQIARSRPPMPIASVTASFYTTVTDPIKDLGRYFEGISLPSIPGLRSSSKPDTSNGDAAKVTKPPSLLRLPSGIEMSGPEGEERLQGSLGERRFNALNPHGCLDFSLPATAVVSEYIDALTSHSGYWSSNEFGAFLLAEIFSTKLDILRTGMGLSMEGEVEKDVFEL